MSRKISLNARLAHDAEGSKEVEVMLVQIKHPETEQIVRLSTATTRLPMARARPGLAPIPKMTTRRSNSF